MTTTVFFLSVLLNSSKQAITTPVCTDCSKINECKSFFLFINPRAGTCTLRINTMGLPTDRHQGKKAWMRRRSWHLSGPLTPGAALKAGRADARRPLRPSYRVASHPPICLHPHWLRPRRHAKEQHLPEGPHPIRQPRGHRWGPRSPRLGGARPVGRQGLWQRHAEAGMGQAEIIIDMVQRQLLAYAVLVFA